MKSTTQTLLSLFISLLILTNCASNGRRSRAALKEMISQGELKKAETFVNSEKFYPDEESRLLKLMELGTIHFLNHNYYQALKSFDAAKELSDKLFTVSISKKVKAAITNGSSDNYYGEKFERSMIRYYQALTHYKLSLVGRYESYTVAGPSQQIKKGSEEVKPNIVPEKLLSSQEKTFHLRATKNILLEWNALLDSYKSTTGGVVTYKDDLMAKVFGGYIHEINGSRSDLRIARDLYKAAKEVLYKNFNTLSTYNKLNEKFIKDFSKLPNLPRKKVDSEYVSKTAYAENLIKYLDERISDLSKGRSHNTYFVVEKGFITPKKAKVYNFPIPLAGITVDVGGFVGFSTRVLALAAGTAPRIAFELPEVPLSPIAEESTLVLKKDGQEVSRKDLVVVNPLSDLAHLIMEQESSSIYKGIGARVAGKHLAALLAAYTTYKLTKKNSGDFLAYAAASLAYAAANKGIQASEKADLRSWTLLPHHFRMVSFDLKPGSYEVFYELKKGDTNTTKKLNDIVIQPKNKILNVIRDF